MLVALAAGSAGRGGRGESGLARRPVLPDFTRAAAASVDGATTTGMHEATGCGGRCQIANHWGRYQVGVERRAERGLWLVDLTGDDRAHTALSELVARWNREVEAREARGQDIPKIGYFRDDRKAGKCSPDPARTQAWDLPGYSVLLVCNGRVLDAMGRAYVVAGGPHWGTTVLPWIYVDMADTFCNGGPMTQAQLVSAFAHELGHSMGLDHRSGLTLMNRNASGVCAGLWFDEHDLEALGAIYAHPAD